ncbi:MAG: hypothetical protein II918_06145 [Firmicutes bacterium]|nr:hypothetical protein [Bacillota bacterium]
MRVFCGALVIMMTCLGLAGCGIPMAKTLTEVSNVSAIGMSFLPELPNFSTPTSREVPNVISPVNEEAFDLTEPTASETLEALFTTVDLMDATIADLQEEMEAGKLTAEQLTQMYMDRIEAYDDKLDLNSIISINPNALKEARKLDRERLNGDVRGPLHGIPIVIKANIDVKGMATSAGAKILKNMVATEDSFVVKQLKDAGAVILAQANMSEFAFATSSSRSTLGGYVHNAYDTTRTPAGSSGGTAVAVTCNFAAAGVGTDTDKLVGDGYTDSLTEDGLKGMRIGYLNYSFGYSYVSGDDLKNARLNSKIKPMLRKAIRNLEKAGAELVDLSDVLTTEKIERITAGIDAYTFEYDLNKYLKNKGETAKYKTLRDLFAYGRDGSTYMYLDLVSSGTGNPARSFGTTSNPYWKKFGEFQRIGGWNRALEGRAKIAKILKENDVDAVVFLNFFDVAEKEKPLIEAAQSNADYDMSFGSKLGLPEISIPMGFSRASSSYRNEMPLGLSVFAAYGKEQKLMKIAYAYEKAAGKSIRRMPDETPALEDKALNKFLKNLTKEAYAISNTKYSKGFKEKEERMLKACRRAEKVNTKDPCATYEVARELADAYDNVLIHMELDQQKGLTQAFSGESILCSSGMSHGNL